MNELICTELVLPKTQDGVSRPPEFAVDTARTPHIAGDLRSPIRSVATRRGTSTAAAAVPKAPIDKDGEPHRGKKEIRHAVDATRVHFPSTRTRADESGPEPPLCGTVSFRPDPRHAVAALRPTQIVHVPPPVPKYIRSTLNVVELYAGTARSVEPFRDWKRASIALLVDNASYARDTFLVNFPTATYVHADVRRLSAQRITSFINGDTDVLLGCPPCQGFSDTGTRDPADSRNSHLLRFAALASALRPRAIAMENVPRAAGSREFRRFTRSLEAVGYRWTAGILNAALRGSGQSRQRLVYIAFRKDVDLAPSIPPAPYGGDRLYFHYSSESMMSLASDRVGMLGETPATQHLSALLPFRDQVLGVKPIPYVQDILAGLPAVGTRRADEVAHRAWPHGPVQLRRMGKVREGGRWGGGRDHYSHSYGRLHRRGIARTVTTYFGNAGSGRFWHPTENRALTLREAARLQGFPDSFKFSPPFSHAAKLVGNALDKAISSTIYDVIRRGLE